VATLLDRRSADGHWIGRLSSSALSTATAINALRLVDASTHAAGIEAGVQWLVATQLADGSWGDTVASKGNLSTTLLCWAVLGAVADGRTTGDGMTAAVERAAVWIRRQTGSLEPGAIAATLAAIYGRDRTFSVPILTHIALCGRFGDPRAAETWRVVPQLPFELAALPQAWFRLVDMQVVSYALPALIAIGRVIHRFSPSKSRVLRWIRDCAEDKAMAVLERIQPENGGFLEATPLTSFVLMSLAAMGEDNSEVKEQSEDRENSPMH
jgi:squalene-hopene/tetraprenyl-beta-curcumene cyclase